MSVRQDRPFPIQPRANGAMAAVLDAATGLALVCGLLGALLPDAAGRLLAWAACGIVVVSPLARVAWLCARWVQRRDLRYAALAAGLLAAVALGAALAVLQR